MSSNMVRVVALGAYSESIEVVTPWASEAMVNGTAEYSQMIKVSRSEGQAALLVDISSTGSPDVDITIEVSVDGVVWHAPKDVNGTTLAVVYTALGAGKHYIVFSPAIAKYMRFKFDPDANTTVTRAEYIELEEA